MTMKREKKEIGFGKIRRDMLNMFAT